MVRPEPAPVSNEPFTPEIFKTPDALSQRQKTASYISQSEKGSV